MHALNAQLTNSLRKCENRLFPQEFKLKCVDVQLKIIKCYSALQLCTRDFNFKPDYLFFPQLIFLMISTNIQEHCVT